MSLVKGPATPPLGRGSAELRTGTGTTGGECAAQIRNGGYAGEKLSELTTLEYGTYLQEHTANEQQDTFLTLFVNNEGRAHGAVDDELFFEPPYQTHASGNPSLPEQGGVELGRWQTWNAAAGGWWDNNEELGTPGAGVEPLSKYLEDHPEAVIVNSSRGGGVRVAVGEAEEDAKFVSYVDDFTIGFGAESTTYNFEPTPPTATISSPSGGGVYDKGASVPTEFACSPSPAEPGFEFGEAGIEAGSPIASCKDSNGVEGNPGSGALDTGTLGGHILFGDREERRLRRSDGGNQLHGGGRAVGRNGHGVVGHRNRSDARRDGHPQRLERHRLSLRIWRLAVPGIERSVLVVSGRGHQPGSRDRETDRPDPGSDLRLPHRGDERRRHQPWLRTDVQNPGHAAAPDDHAHIPQTGIHRRRHDRDDHRDESRRRQRSEVRPLHGHGDDGYAHVDHGHLAGRDGRRSTSP